MHSLTAMARLNGEVKVEDEEDGDDDFRKQIVFTFVLTAPSAVPLSHPNWFNCRLTSKDSEQVYFPLLPSFDGSGSGSGASKHQSYGDTRCLGHVFMGRARGCCADQMEDAV